MLPVAPVEPLAATLDAREGRRVPSGSCTGEMRALHKAPPVDPLDLSSSGCRLIRFVNLWKK